VIQHKFLSKRFDEAAILATLAKVAFQPEPSLSEQDMMVLAALRRSSPEWDFPLDATAEKLASYDEQQIVGLTSNVKGILHEMEFQKLENEDGDSVVAAMYPDTNHKSVDIQLMDQNTGEHWDVQLKATDNMSLIHDWMALNPDTEILVTEELAEKMDLPSSGIRNEDLKLRVDEFVDEMIMMSRDREDSVWDSFPVLVAASAGIVVFELWRRYRRSEISFQDFRFLTMKTLGIKGAKYAAIFTALAVPGLNIIVGAYLLGSLIISVHGLSLWAKRKSFKPFAFLNVKSANKH
jgi:hypothetical protein